MKMVQNEFKFIAKNKIILISLIAIMIIPFLYSIFFLKSVWDPYGSTGNLPVAVVNNDVPTTYEGQKLNAGKDLVKELKKNDQIGWRFVSAKKAKQGLKDKEYYTVITLPKNFSANAATVLDKHPKKMQINYKTNDSLNFIAEVISEAGAKQVNAELRETVTKSYAKVMFKQVKTAGKGFTTAAKGAKKLTDGSITLADGLNTYTAGVDKVNDGVMTMKTSVVPLSDGIQKLAAGSKALDTGLQTLNSKTGTLASGASQLNSGASQLNTGLQTLNSKTGALSSGVSQLNSGASQLNSGVSAYTDGTDQLNTGLTKLNGQSGKLASGATKLAASTSQLPTGVAGLYVLNSVMNQGIGTISNELNGQADQMKDLAAMPATMKSVNQQSKDLSTMLENLKPSMALLVQLNNTYKANEQTIAQLPALGTQLSGFKTLLTTSGTTIAGNSKATLTDVATISAESSKLSPAGQKALQDIQGKTTSNLTALKAINDATSQLDVDKISGMINQLTPVLGQMKQLDTAVSQLTELSTESEQLLKVSDQLTNAEMRTKITTLMGKMTTLTNRVNQLNVLSTKATGIATQLNSGVNGNNPVIDASKLTSEDAVTKQVASIASQSTMTPQIGQLVAGVNAYTAGVGSATTGSSTLVSKNTQLVAGSTQLAAGTTQLNGQVPALTGGIGQLATGSTQLAAGTAQLNSQVPQLTSGVSQLATGSTTLNGGLVQLNGKIPTLTSGVDQLADGTSQLAANSTKLNSGATQLKNGNKTLTTGLNTGANKVNSIKLTNSTADMFAAPSDLKHSNYSYVPNYGHALAPYVLSLALFVGAIVFNFAYPIRKISMEGQSATAWFLSKIAVGAIVAIGMGLIEPALMMVAGLNVDHPAQFFLISVTFALTSMAIIMFLSMAFDNPGRFLAMVLLMLQLGGSGGTFPMEITNHFYNVIHPFLPMSYSILGFRQAITSGLGNGQIVQTFFVLLLFIAIALVLLWISMTHLQKIGQAGISQLDDNQKLQDVEK